MTSNPNLFSSHKVIHKVIHNLRVSTGDYPSLTRKKSCFHFTLDALGESKRTFCLFFRLVLCCFPTIFRCFSADIEKKRANRLVEWCFHYPRPHPLIHDLQIFFYYRENTTEGEGGDGSENTNARGN